MTPTACSRLSALRQTASLQRGLAGVEIIAALGLFPPLLVAAHSITSTVIAVPILSVYVWRSMLRIRSLSQLRRQLRLEELFVRQDLNLVQLRHCLQNPVHLWSSSLVLEGLRGVFSHPLPRLLTPSERSERLSIYFRRTLHTLRPASLHPEWLLPLGACGAVVLGANMESLKGASVLLPVSIVLLVSFVALIAAQVAVVRVIRRGLASAEQALGDWTQEARLSNVLFDRRKLYAHTLLYEARPWFHTPQA